MRDEGRQAALIPRPSSPGSGLSTLDSPLSCRQLYRQNEGWAKLLVAIIADPDEVGSPVLDAVEALLDAGDPGLANEVDEALRLRVAREGRESRESRDECRELAGRTSAGSRSPDPRYQVRLPREPAGRCDAA